MPCWKQACQVSSHGCLSISSYVAITLSPRVAASTRHHSHHDGEANHLSCCARRVVAIRRHASSSTVRRPRFFFRANRLWLPINRAEPPRCAAATRQARAPAALALARARATRRPHDGTAHCRRHHAVPPIAVSPPRPRRCRVPAGFAASTLARFNTAAVHVDVELPRCRPCRCPPRL